MSAPGADASRQRIDLALHFAANGIEVQALLVEIAVQRGAVEWPGDEAAELQACGEHETRGNDAACSDHSQDSRLLQVELEHAARPARHDL